MLSYYLTDMSFFQALIHDPLTRFIAQTITIITVSRMLGILAKWIRQPLVIAEICAGILLGPSLMGLFFPEATQFLFSPDSLGVLQVVSHVGLILFMFLVGLELNPSMLKGRGHTSVVISHTSIIVPFVLGLLLAIYLYPRYSDESVPFMAFGLFLGAAMSITAFPVLARILTERKLLRTRVGAVTITCAAVDDVTAWCVLAFVVSFARATGMLDAVKTTGMALAYILFMWWWVRPLLRRLVARVGSPEAMSQDIVALVLVMVFVSGWITEIIGIHALFGAFLLGAIFPKDGSFAHTLAGKLEDLVLIVLLPLFFALSGLRTQIGLLNQPSDWIVCGTVIAVACIGKFGGSAIPARMTGLTWREAGALGILMNTRGLMELIVLNIGLDLGVISPAVFTMMVLMALVTTFMTTPILRLVYPDEVMARNLVEAADSSPAATPAGAGYNVLVCSAHAASGRGLVALARDLVGSDKAPICALHLRAPASRESDLIGDESAAACPDALETIVSYAREHNIDVRPLSFVSSEPAGDIVRVAETRNTELVLLGVHKPLFNQSLLGGVVHDVLKGASSGVGVFLDRGLGKVERILLPFQGSPHDLAALHLARRLIRNVGAKIAVFHIVSPNRKGALNTVRSVFGEGDGSVSFEAVEHADPARAVVERTRNGIDLVIVGLGQEWGLEERRFGIQPEHLIEESQASLLIVRSARSKEATQKS